MYVHAHAALLVKAGFCAEVEPCVILREPTVSVSAAEKCDNCNQLVLPFLCVARGTAVPITLWCRLHITLAPAVLSGRGAGAGAGAGAGQTLPAKILANLPGTPCGVCSCVLWPWLSLLAAICVSEVVCSAPPHLPQSYCVTHCVEPSQWLRCLSTDPCLPFLAWLFRVPKMLAWFPIT
jgi:hypothetical protein